jgi:hypothetical protein
MTGVFAPDYDSGHGDLLKAYLVPINAYGGPTEQCRGRFLARGHIILCDDWNQYD